MNTTNEQSIFFRPMIETNMKLDRKFFKRKKDIFESSKLKHSKNKTNEDEKSTLNKEKSEEKLELPDIYLYSKPKQKEIIPISEKMKIMKEISKNLIFVNKRISVINTDLFSLINEPTKPVSYDCDVYKNELFLLNEILFECGISLKSRDVLILEGQESKNKYSLFTNHPKHPQSLCCQFEVIIKHIDFLSPQKYKFSRSKSFDKNIKSLITINCLKCGQDIIKILPISENSEENNMKRSEFNEEKRLINFSKLISSGRFKKLLINDDSIELMESRNISGLLSRSKTSLKNMKENSLTLRLEDMKSKRYERENRVKSQQVSLELKEKFKENKTYDLIKKREKLSINKFFNYQQNND